MKFSLPLKVLYRGLIGLAVFALILGIANFLKIYISHPFYHFFVNTFNSALWIIVILSLLFLAADFFRVLKFPYDLPYPIINAFGYVYLTSFIFELVPLIEMFSGTEIPWKMSTAKAVVAIAVFALVTIFGYINVARHRYKQQPAIEEQKPEKKTNKKKK